MRTSHAIIIQLIKEETDWIGIRMDWIGEMQDWCEMAVIICN